jgi:putative ABC transport system permease protein
VSNVPGIDSAAAISRLPMIGATQSTSYQTETHPLPPQEWPMADTRIASPAYFATLQIPLLQGRDFTVTDRADTPLVIIVNREAAERLWPGDTAVGKRMQIYPEKTWRTVIGIVGGVKLQKLDSESVPTLYIPYAQNPFPTAARSSFVVVRTSMNPETTHRVLKEALATVDDGQAIGPLQSLSQAVASTVSLRRFTTFLISGFAIAATLLALLGTYGVMSFAVSVRTLEIGIRAALGAAPRILLWWVLREGLGLTAVGITLGLVLAMSSLDLLAHVVYGVSVRDPRVFATVVAGLVSASLVACYLPGRRAAAVDPIAAIRHD